MRTFGVRILVDRDPANDCYDVRYSGGEVMERALPLSMIRTPQYPPGFCHPHMIVGTPGIIKASMSKGDPLLGPMHRYNAIQCCKL